MTAVTGAAHAARLRPWAVWTAGFLAFPVAGVAGRLAAGRVDDLLAALLGGAVTGLVIGIAQGLAGRGAVPAGRWAAATALGLALGLAVGAAAVGYRTSLPDLAVMGALTGLPLGAAQALALPPGTRRRWLWALATPVLWSLGWTVTTLIGFEVQTQVTVFGASGAVVVSALSGLLLLGMSRPEGSRPPRP